MNPNSQQQAEQLDDFLAARLPGEQAPAVELERDETELASALVQLARSAEPDQPFARELEAKLLGAARWKRAGSEKTSKADQALRPKAAAYLSRSPLRGWPAAGLAAAAVVAAAVLFFIINQPPAANAAEIVQKARAAANVAAGGALQSLELNETSTLKTSGGETIRSQAARWFKAPGSWRVEIQSTVAGADGQDLPGRAASSLAITDGTTVWYLDRVQNSATIAPLPANGTGNAYITAFGAQPDSLNALLARAASCFDPRLQGTDTIAGRPVYVVDLGANKCVAAAETNGRSLIWVDEQTFFVLKHVQYNASGGEPVATTEVTAVRYNPSLEAALFTFTPPSGATVQDYRPKPAPAADQFQQQIEALARPADFPLFAPGYVPQGLSPREPRTGSLGGIELNYVPTAEVSKPSAAILTGLLIVEQKATYELVTQWTEGAKPVQLANGKGWLRTDAPNPVGGGMDAAAYVLRGGTLVSIASFKVAPDELRKTADSLRTVPGSHAPLPDPAPPVLAGLRGKVSFPVMVPTALPAGLTAEPPLGGDKPDSTVEIDYHTADGAIALVVINGPAGSSPDLAAVKGEDIPLTIGITAHLILDLEGGWVLWWEQAGGLVKLSGPNLTKADLIRIANSMDKTADLGQVQAVAVRPTPGPLPAPRFNVLEPAWLPEPMTRQADYQKAPPEFGSWIAVTYMPQGTNQPRTPLILFEKPKALVADRAVDPQATTKKIGSYDVTITGTAKECWNLDWDVGDVHFSLANAYNESGSARYTCDQLARIVASLAPTSSVTPSRAAGPGEHGTLVVILVERRRP